MPNLLSRSGPSGKALFPVLRCVLLCLVSLVSGGCGNAPKAQPRPAGWPEQLRFLVSISQENPEAEASRLAPIGRYLESQLHIPVEIIGSSGYGVAIEALRARKIEACTTGPFAYLIASEKANSEVIAMRGTLDGSPANYSGGLAVTAASPLHTIEDVVRHAKELTVSFVDPASASGNLVQRAYLDSLGIDPEKHFKKVVYSQGHPASALTLLAGKTDLAAVGETTLPALVRAHQMKEGDLRFLWVSPGIPEGPVAVRKDLPQDFKQRLQEALVNMRTLAPDAFLNMTAKIYIERYRNSSFVPATDASFDPLRKMAHGMKLAQLLD